MAIHNETGFEPAEEHGEREAHNDGRVSGYAVIALPKRGGDMTELGIFSTFAAAERAAEKHRENAWRLCRHSERAGRGEYGNENLLICSHHDHGGDGATVEWDTNHVWDMDEYIDGRFAEAWAEAEALEPAEAEH